MVSHGRLERRFSLADIMRMGLLIETGTHPMLALTTSAGVARAILVVFGAHEFVVEREHTGLSLDDLRFEGPVGPGSRTVTASSDRGRGNRNRFVDSPARSAQAAAIHQ
jgi:hypothetical protein